MEELLQSCGYLASYMGTLLEGEILLLASVVAAKMGYMNFIGALAALFAGAYTRDWATFLLARKSGRQIIEKKPKLKAKLSRVSQWMEKNPVLLLSTYRLLFGFVTVVVVLAGVSNIPMKKFGLLSAISNLIWVIVYGSLGYFCAEEMLANIEWVGGHKALIVSILAGAGLLYWFFIKRKEISFTSK